MHEALRVEGMAFGLLPEQAERAIRRGCKAQGVALGVPEPGAALDARRRWLRCQACVGLTEFGWAEIHTGGLCRHCQAPLRWECPVCKTTSWVDEPRCRCGFSLENLEPLVRHFEAAQRAFRLRHLSEALAQLRLVLQYAPRHVGARNGLQKLHQQIQNIRKLRADYERERAAGRLVAARAVVERWERLVAPTDVRWKSALFDTSSKLVEAERLAARGRALAESDAAAARECYRGALAIAGDLPDAIDGLNRCPPDGPTELFVEVRGGRVALRWTPPIPDGQGPVHFRVLRKRAAAPTHTNDGAIVAEVAGPEWEDLYALGGESWGYAVCSVRNGVSSLYGVSSGPFLVTDDVTNVRVQAASGRVQLSWTLPAGAAGARVVRKSGGPVEGPRDGVAIETGRDHAVDSGLENDRVVHYAIFAVFRGPAGATAASRGVRISAVPGDPPEAVEALRLDPELDGRLWLRWTPPAHGRVRILRTSQPVPWLRGERRSREELDALEGLWLDPASQGAAFDTLLGEATIFHYTAVTLGTGLAAIGASAAWAMLADPENLRVARLPANPDQVMARWTWTETRPGAKALLAARPGRFPTGPEDPEATKTVVDANTYWHQGHLMIELPEGEDAPWHLVVYSCLDIAEERWYSPGIEPGARCLAPSSRSALTVYYSVRPPRLGGSWDVVVRTEPAGAEIGPTILVARPRVLPLTARDGVVVARFPACRDETTLRFRPATRLHGRKLRLFLDPAAGAGGDAKATLLVPRS